MQKTVIEAECVCIACYHGTKEQLFATLSHIDEHGVRAPNGKIVKLVFYVSNLTLRDYQSTD